MSVADGRIGNQYHVAGVPAIGLFRPNLARQLGDQNRLDPRLVDAGPYNGKYVLPYRVIYDEAHIVHRDAFRMLNKINFYTVLAWPRLKRQRLNICHEAAQARLTTNIFAFHQ